MVATKGKGTYMDGDWTTNPQDGFTVKTGATTFQGAQQAGSPAFLRADGYLDSSIHPPLAIPASKLIPDVSLLSLPNGAFEQGAEGWTTAVTGGGALAIDATASITGVNAFRFTTSATTDTATLTSPVFLCGENIPIVAKIRAALVSGTSNAALTVNWLTNSKGANGSSTVTLAALVAAFGEQGAILTPPAGTRYGQVVLQASGAVGSFRCDEVRVNRAPNELETPAYLTPTFAGALNSRANYARFADIGVSARDFLKGDGTVESAAAVAAFVAAVPDRGIAYFPAGVYNFPGALTFTDKAVLVMGAARECVTLIFSGASDGIVFYVTSDQSKRVGVRNMRVLPAYQKTSGSDTNNNGVAISVRMPPTANAGANYSYRQCQIDNVQIGSQNDDPHNPGVAWNWGIKFVNVWYGFITDVDHFALPSMGGFFWVDADATAGDGHYYGAIAPVLSNIKAYYGTSGIYCLGYMEGIEVSCCDFVAFNYGINVPSNAKKGGAAGIDRALAVWVQTCHFNCFVNNFSFDTCEDIMLSNINLGSIHTATKQNVVALNLYDVLGVSVVGGTALGGGAAYSDGTSPQDCFLICDGSGLGTSNGRQQGTRNVNVMGIRLVNYYTQCIMTANSYGNRMLHNNIIAGQPLAFSDSGTYNSIIAFDVTGYEYHYKPLLTMSELQPYTPIRTQGYTRAQLYSKFPPAGWGTSFYMVTNPETNQGEMVYSNGSSWIYAGSGAAVTNS